MNQETGQAVGEIVELLLTRCHEGDAAGVKNALRSPVLEDLRRQHPGLANVHLAFGFARLLAEECPSEARDDRGVPRLDRLVGDGAELPGYVDARIAVGQEIGQPVSKADAKASNARYAEGIPLAQQFMRLWILSPAAVPDFVHAQSARSAVIVDAVWEVLFSACHAIRARPGNATH